LKVSGSDDDGVDAAAAACATHNAGVACAWHIAVALWGFPSLVAVVHPTVACIPNLNPEETEVLAQVVAEVGGHRCDSCICAPSRQPTRVLLGGAVTSRQTRVGSAVCIGAIGESVGAEENRQVPG
jgi:hypothetical protein